MRVVTSSLGIELRDYQRESVDAIMDEISCGRHTVCALPTGSGKSVVIAEVCRRIRGRALVVTHRKELIAQNAAKMDDCDGIGIYSAGIGRRETDSRVIFAGVQSIYRRMAELQASGPFDAIIIDEAHMVPPRGAKSMYASIFDACPNIIRIGMTATPYRLNDGRIWGENGSWFDSMAMQVSIIDLVEKGFLSPLVGVSAASKLDLSSVRTQAGDFVTSQLSKASSEDDVVNLALDEVCYLARDRQSWLVFCVDRAHARIVLDGLRGRGVSSEMVLGTTPGDERDATLMAFQEGQFRSLVNVGVLTTGFDAPAVDCVAILRATQSKSLMVQMLGRGSRLSPGKTNCLVLDLADNLQRHVPIDGIPAIKKSPKRAEIDSREQEAKIAEAKSRQREAKHGFLAAYGIDPLTGEGARGETLLLVREVKYFTKKARRFPEKTNIVASYKCEDLSGNSRTVTKFILTEYSGRPNIEARSWFKRRGIDMPATANAGLRVLRTSSAPSAILVRKSGGWDEIVSEYFG